MNGDDVWCWGWRHRRLAWGGGAFGVWCRQPWRAKGLPVVRGLRPPETEAGTAGAPLTRLPPPSWGRMKSPSASGRRSRDTSSGNVSARRKVDAPGFIVYPRCIVAIRLRVDCAIVQLHNSQFSVNDLVPECYECVLKFCSVLKCRWCVVQFLNMVVDAFCASIRFCTKQYILIL